MKVEGILRSKRTNVVTANPSATVGSIVQRLHQERIGAIVVTENGRVLGMISERDVIRGLADRGPAILDRQVADLMTRPVHSCSLHDSVKHLMSEMTRKRIRHLPSSTTAFSAASSASATSSRTVSTKSRWRRTCSVGTGGRL